MEETVIKRDGRSEPVQFDKISRRLLKLKNDAEEYLQRPLHIKISEIAKKTIAQIYDGITTSELDEEAAEVAAYITDHPDYLLFAGQILLSNLEANNRDCLSFVSYAEKAYNFQEERTGEVNHLISDELVTIARKYGHLIDRRIDMRRNYMFDYFGAQTLIKGKYLLCAYKTIQKNRVTNREMVPFETPQHMWMRVALGIHGWNLEAAFEHYDLLSLQYGTMATPTLFNAGTPKSQLSSCFIAGTKVYTMTGPKSIEDVVVGDMVITHKNRWRPVTQLHTNPLNNRSLYQIEYETPKSESKITELKQVVVTGNHRFWCITPDNETPRWIEVEEMTPETHIAWTSYLRQTLHDSPLPVSPETRFTPLKSISLYRDHIPDYVYTLGVKEDHSYTVEGLMAENCFLVMLKNDSLDGIYDTLKQCAIISKYAGGLGINIHNLRSTGSYIKGTNGTSNGIVPMLQNFNATARYVDQCWELDTTVYTRLGPKCIGDVVPNDELVTKSGKFYPVMEVVHDHYSGKMVEISPKYGFKPFKVTPAHPLLVMHTAGLMMNDIRTRLKNHRLRPEWIDAIDIQQNDHIGFPIPQYTQDVSSYSHDDCRMMGIMIGDGYFSQNRNEAGVHLNNTTKVNTMNFVKQYLTEQAIKYWIYESKKSNGVKVGWTPPFRFKITRQMIYDQSGNKQIPPHMLHLPETKLVSLIHGLIETDGSLSDNRIRIEMTSLNVIESLRYMLLRLGIPTSGNVRDRRGNCHELPNGRGKIENKKISYDLRIPRDPKLCKVLNIQSAQELRYYTHEGIIYSRVNSVKVIPDYEGEVVDMKLHAPEDDRNYLTHVGLSKNGGGKRRGSFAIYLEPWHADLMSFLDLKKVNGAESERCRDLFYGLWIPDLFMKRAIQGFEGKNVMWSFMDPNVCPGLSDCWGAEFEALYEQYESEGKYVDQVPAKQVMTAILMAMIETGQPYFLYKDACNRKSNQQNLGTIKSSNLCVAGETLVLTKEHGHVPIRDVVDQKLHVWNGEQWSDVTVRKTNASAEVLKVNFSNGSELYCTPYHKFFVESQRAESSEETVEARTLKPGTRLKTFRLPSSDEKIKLTVTNVETTDRMIPTYCFNEPLRHAGIFNGVLTGNCTEIIEHSSPDSSGVCNLASLSLPAFVDRKNQTFDFQKLYEVSRVFIRALNKVIDRNYYPVPEAKNSNLKNRPVGLGVQGLADVFMYLRMRYGDEASKKLNRDISETMYFAAMTESHALTQELDEKGEKVGPYATIEGSPISRGVFQFEMWADDCDCWQPNPELGWDWDGLREKIKRDGVRNSLTIAQMPTASTSQILGNMEMFEPYFGMMFVRKTKVGEFYQYCRPLIEELVELGLWKSEKHPETNEDYIPMKEKIKAAKGSIQEIKEIPQEIKNLYVGVQDIKLSDITIMARDRGIFTDQSMSLNVHYKNKPNLMPDMLKYLTFAWKLGLKTASYYTRTIQKMSALDFTGEHANLDQRKTAVRASSKTKSMAHESKVTEEKKIESKPKGWVCTEDECVSCGA